MSRLAPMCLVCKHFRRAGTPPPDYTAFPEGIPSAILHFEHDHRDPYPGDNGVRFEPAADRSPELVEGALRMHARHVAIHKALSAAEDPADTPEGGAR